jgi:hypothetical protein
MAGQEQKVPESDSETYEGDQQYENSGPDVYYGHDEAELLDVREHSPEAMIVAIEQVYRQLYVLVC